MNSGCSVGSPRRCASANTIASTGGGDPRYLWTIKVRVSSGTVHEYVRVFESYRDGGKVKQRVVADLDRKDVLLAVLPKLGRLLTGETEPEPSDPAGLHVSETATWGPVFVVRALCEQIGLCDILDRHHGRASGVSFTARAFVLVANRLMAPASEHGLAVWLETDFVFDRQGRRSIPRWHQRRRVRVHHRQLDRPPSFARSGANEIPPKQEQEILGAPAQFLHIRDLVGTVNPFMDVDNVRITKVRPWVRLSVSAVPPGQPRAAGWRRNAPTQELLRLG